MTSVSNVNQDTQVQTATPEVSSNPLSGDLSNMFLELLVAQISHQNPLDPMDGTQYVSQLAEFSSVESLQSLRADSQRSLDMQHSQQVLQATSLIGRKVTIPTNEVTLSKEGSVTGEMRLSTDSSPVMIRLYNQADEMVDQRTFHNVEAGALAFEFEDQAAGAYSIEANAFVKGRAQPSSVHLTGEVSRVSVGDSVNDISLQVQGLGTHSLLDVEQFAIGNKG